MAYRNLLAQFAPRQQPASGSAWADRVVPRAQQVPPPLIYPESPWMPRKPDYETPTGRVYDPIDVMRRGLNPPTYASEYTIGDLPGYLNVPMPQPVRPTRPDDPRQIPSWVWWASP